MKEMTRQEYDSRDYSFNEIEDDPRLVSAKKEMLVTFFAYLIYVIVLLSLVYYYAAQDVQEMHYLFGLPRYLSVLAIVAVVGGVCMACITHFIFKPENLEDEQSDQNE